MAVRIPFAAFLCFIGILLLGKEEGYCLRSANGGETLLVDIQGGRGSLGVAALWEKFVEALRAGRMEEAYRCFSPLSRTHLSYEQFCLRHHPLTLSGEILVSAAEDGRFQICGDLAMLRFMSLPVGAEKTHPSPHAILVTAMFVREGEQWYLVAEERMEKARIEAETRNFLRRLAMFDPIQKARKRGDPLSSEALQLKAQELFATAEGKACLEHYTFELQQRGGSSLLLAVPRVSHLRAFAIQEGKKVFEVQIEGGKVTLLPPSREEEKETDTSLSPPPDLGDPAQAGYASLFPPESSQGSPPLPKNEVTDPVLSDEEDPPIPPLPPLPLGLPQDESRSPKESIREIPGLFDAEEL